MRIRKLVETLNAYFSGYDGKGCDYLSDEIGVRAENFSRLSKEKKQEIIRRFIEAFGNCLTNDLEVLALTDEKKPVDYQVLETFIRVGEAALALLRLTEHYEVELARPDESFEE